MPTEVNRLAQEWLRLDKDPATRAEIERLLYENDAEELGRRLLTSEPNIKAWAIATHADCTNANKGLTFGTAGLRAQMGAGFSQLNALTIIQTSQGLAEYLLASDHQNAESGVVIGHDARHNSQRFAELVAAVFVHKKFRVLWYEDLVHTPMVPFAVKHLDASAGVMITASHNPAQDNGYKVYAANGAQINSPIDAEIAASIANNLEPEVWGFSEHVNSQLDILRPMKLKYQDVVTGQTDLREHIDNFPRFVYTPMHGVGLPFLIGILNRCQLGRSFVLVKEQAEPDPTFPTVKYPNPEESGALDLAMATADDNGIKMILANDPDADRFAVAEKIGDEWHQFTGDQVGCLLAFYLFSCSSRTMGPDDYMLNSAVSSEMLTVMGHKEGFSVVETLTGFKWLGNVALELQKDGKRVHFAYEEALGYMLPEVVHDKDGIAAAFVFLSACANWGSPWAKLQQLYERYGFFETMNTYWRSPDIVTTQQAFDTIRSVGDPYPEQVGSRKVLRWRDLTMGYDSATKDHAPLLPCSQSSQMITCWLSETEKDEGVRFTIRASGTEPKIKIYLECRSMNLDAAKEGASEALRSLRKEWFNGPKLVIEEKYSSTG